MASFTAALQAARITKGPLCSVGMILEEVDAKDRAAITDALNKTIKQQQHAEIERALLKMHDDGDVETKVGRGAVGRHRKRECSCPDGGSG